MLRAALRGTTAVAGALLGLGLLAVPASADGLVPDGCAGSVVYACFGDGTTPPPTPWDEYGRVQYASVPVTLTAPSTVVVPSTTVGGQRIGGVVVVVGGQTVGGVSYTFGGPTAPVPTGFVVPVNVCAVVTCLQAGTPIVVPGAPLPFVPVVVPDTRVPVQNVPVPLVGTVPTATTPTVATPPVYEHVVTLQLYTQWAELWFAGASMCRSGNGSLYSADAVLFEYFRCGGGTYAVPATALLFVAAAMRFGEDRADDVIDLLP